MRTLHNLITATPAPEFQISFRAGHPSALLWAWYGVGQDATRNPEQGTEIGLRGDLRFSQENTGSGIS